jgi:hypothetical protein
LAGCFHAAAGPAPAISLEILQRLLSGTASAENITMYPVPADPVANVEKTAAPLAQAPVSGAMEATGSSPVAEPLPTRKQPVGLPELMELRT